MKWRTSEYIPLLKDICWISKSQFTNCVAPCFYPINSSDWFHKTNDWVTLPKWVWFTYHDLSQDDLAKNSGWLTVTLVPRQCFPLIKTRLKLCIKTGNI